MVETIGFPVTANQSSAGNYLPIDSDTLAGCTVTNSSAYAVEYSTGCAWKTIAAGGSATINTDAIATTSLRFRKKTGDSIPVVLSVAVTHPGTAPAKLATDVGGKVLGFSSAYGPLGRGGNIGTRIFGGRMGTFDNTTQQTFHVVLTTAQHFDAVRLIFANGTTSTATVGVAKVSPLSDLSTAANQNNSGGTWTSVTFAGGSATGTIPAAGGASFRRSFLLSDWISVSSLDRVDGGTFPAIAVRAYISTSGTIGVLGNGTDIFTNWDTNPSGRVHIMRNQAGDQVTAPGGFSSTTNTSQSPIVGIQYAARGRVITVMGIGDSITEGRGTYKGEGFGMPACAAISDINGVAVEWSNCGWSGASPSQIMALGVDTLQYFSPDIFVLPNGSPNVSAAPITASGITSSRQMLYRLLAECQIKGVRPLIWTWLPTNDTVKAWNSSDSLRRAWNDDTRRLATQRGLLVLDADAVLAGVDNGAGQIQMLAGSSSDGVHPNDTGNALLAAEFKKAFAILSQ